MLLLAPAHNVANMVGYKKGRALERKSLIGKEQLSRSKRNYVKI